VALSESLLGDRFSALAPDVRRAHAAPLAAEGTMDVEHGSHWAVPLLVALMRLPQAGRARPTRLTVVESGGGLAWTRRIGSSVVRTRERASGSRLVEQLGLGEIVFDLDVVAGALVYRQVGARVGGIVLPRAVSPHVHAQVSSAASGWRVDVEIAWRGHLVCRYGGVMEAT
jgi:hypothetical protein